MRKVILSVKKNYCYEVIKMVCDGNMNRKMAEVKLCVSYRTISRYIAGYRAYGKAFFSMGISVSLLLRLFLLILSL